MTIAATLEKLTLFEGFSPADIETLAKEEIWARLSAEPTFERRVMALAGLDVPAPLRGVLEEILLAFPNRGR